MGKTIQHQELAKRAVVKERVAKHIDEEFIPLFVDEFGEYLDSGKPELKRTGKPKLTTNRFLITSFECSAQIKIVFDKTAIQFDQEITISGAYDSTIGTLPLPEKMKLTYPSYPTYSAYSNSGIYESIFIEFKKQLLESSDL